MLTIPPVNLKDALRLTPAQMNAIHFGGNRTPLTPEQLRDSAADTETGTTSGVSLLRED